MSKYTAEQAFLRSEDVKYSIGIDYKLTPACSDEVIDMLRDYAAILRERESAKARVTHTMIREAKDAFENSSARDATGWWRSALEAVAPMLASARANQEPYCYTVEQKNGLSQGAMCRTKAECEASPLFDPENEHVIPLYREPVLASARVPDERPELDPVKMNAEGKSVTEWERGYNEGWNDCRDAMLAAAPKPETEE